MKARTVLVPLAVLFLGLVGSRGMFMRIDTQAVPIDRVLANIERRLVANTNDVKTLYLLARIHAMAYSTNITTLDMTTNGVQMEPFFGYPGTYTEVPSEVFNSPDPQVRAAARQHLTNAISYYRRAATLMLKGTNTAEHKRTVSAINLGLAWCLEHNGHRDEAISTYRKALQLAWDLEIEPTPSLKEQLGWSWDKIRSKQSPFSKPSRSLGPGRTISEEAIECLLKLLDPTKDAKEVTQLEKDKLTILGMGRWITPILVPLETNASFESLVDPAANVAFDLDGSGLKRRWGWITPKAAWLVFDHDGSGRITSGLQMFGNVTFWIFWRDGYEALSSLDDNADGKIAGVELKGLSLWQDANSNGLAEAGEVRPATDYGVTALDCTSQLHPTGIPFSPHGIQFRDGSTRPTYDWIVPSKPVAIF